MVANPRSATVMGLLEEARAGACARAQGGGAGRVGVKTLFGRAKDWFLGNF
jgi:cell division protein FtsA